MTYTLSNATGLSDAVTLTLTSAGTQAAGSITTAGIESVTISATDTTTGVAAGATASSVTLVDTAAKTLVVTTNTTLSITNTGTQLKTSQRYSHLSQETLLAAVDAAANATGTNWGAAQAVKAGENLVLAAA